MFMFERILRGKKEKKPLKKSLTIKNNVASERDPA